MRLISFCPVLSIGSTGYPRLLNQRLCGAIVGVLLLALPMGLYASSPAPGLPDLLEVPFRVVAGHAIVSVTVNGAGPFDFIVDTGAETSMVDPEIAQRLAMPVVGQTTLASVTRDAAVPMVMVQQIKLGVGFGGPAVTNLGVMVDPMLGQKANMPTIHGVLGENFLQRFDFLLDNRGQRLVFEQQRGALLAGLNGAHLNLEKQLSAEGKYRRLDIVRGRTWQLGGRDLVMHLDSGANTAVLYSPVRTLFLNLQPWTASVAEGGRSRGAQYLVVPIFEVGRVSLTEMPLGILDNPPDFPKGIDGELPTWLFQSIYFSHSGGFVILNPSKAKHPHPVAIAASDSGN